MAFIVEDGSIVSGANAYCTVEFYREYHAERGVDVTSQDDISVQAAIIIATQYIDNNNKWKGYLVTDEQSLDWPRSSVYDKDARSIDYQSVPFEVQAATAEYAYRQITNEDGIQPDPGTLGAIIEQSSKVGSISKKVRYQDGTGGYFGIRKYPQADNYLKEFSIGGIGANFGSLKRY